jgi:hypothetical protein
LTRDEAMITKLNALSEAPRLESEAA